MKRTVLTFVIAFLVLVSVVLWMTKSGPLSFPEILQFGIIFILVGFGIFIGTRRLKSNLKGEPAEDELSKKVMQKTAAFSYYISLYTWLIMMYISDKTEYETHTIIGAGILVMAVTFFVCWLVFHFAGIKNE
jgi:peptidoglycan/LPS O-acetylase OafA/YrhL